jgi:hypothetical protein
MPIVEAIACVVLAIWFVWSIVDKDAVPAVLNAASAIAAAIVVLDIGVRLWRDRGATGRRP